MWDPPVSVSFPFPFFFLRLRTAFPFFTDSVIRISFENSLLSITGDASGL
jgi:hypothetical protein